MSNNSANSIRNEIHGRGFGVRCLFNCHRTSGLQNWEEPAANMLVSSVGGGLFVQAATSPAMSVGEPCFDFL